MMNPTKERHAPAETGRFDESCPSTPGTNVVAQCADTEAGDVADRLNDEGAGIVDFRHVTPRGRARESANAVGDTNSYSVLRAHLASVGYTLRHTSKGIFIEARRTMSRTMTASDEVESFLRRVAP